MIERFAAAVVVAALVSVAAAIIRRRRPVPRLEGWQAPMRLDRRDFDATEPWLVVLFTSTTCASCDAARTRAMPLRSDAVAVVDVDAAAQPELHRRYAIEAVPITVVADAQGAVHASFVGPFSATDLWAAVAEARAPGSTASECGRIEDQPSG